MSTQHDTHCPYCPDDNQPDVETMDQLVDHLTDVHDAFSAATAGRVNREERVKTDGGQPTERTLEAAAEPHLVGTCEECEGRLIERVLSSHDGTGWVQLVCEECGTEVRIAYEIGGEHPWEKAAEVDGITDATVKDVAWVDCDRCHGYGQIEDPICDLRRAMNGREHPCPRCDATGSVPRVVETDGGRVVRSSDTPQSFQTKRTSDSERPNLQGLSKIARQRWVWGDALSKLSVLGHGSAPD